MCIEIAVDTKLSLLTRIDVTTKYHKIKGGSFTFAAGTISYI